MKALKNELESFSYEMRTNLDSYGSLERYADDQTKTDFLKQINQVIDWIYGDGQNAPKEAFRTKLEEFKKVGLPIKERHRFYTEIEIYFEQFKNFCADMNDRIQMVPHLTDDQRSTILKMHSELDTFLSSIKTAIESKKTSEDPGFSIDDVNNRLDTFKYSVNSILNSPPPVQKPDDKAPPKEEAKPADAEM